MSRSTTPTPESVARNKGTAALPAISKHWAIYPGYEMSPAAFKKFVYKMLEPRHPRSPETLDKISIYHVYIKYEIWRELMSDQGIKIPRVLLLFEDEDRNVVTGCHWGTRIFGYAGQARLDAGGGWTREVERDRQRLEGFTRKFASVGGQLDKKDLSFRWMKGPKGRPQFDLRTT